MTWLLVPGGYGEVGANWVNPGGAVDREEYAGSEGSIVEKAPFSLGNYQKEPWWVTSIERMGGGWDCGVHAA